MISVDLRLLVRKKKQCFDLHDIFSDLASVVQEKSVGFA
jgi:hypothetical protein